jgi:kynurenine formamidase
MKPIDITVPLDARLPAHPGNTPFTVETVERIARRDGSNLSPLHMKAEPGIDNPEAGIDDRRALPLWVVDADGAPDRVLPRRN